MFRPMRRKQKEISPDAVKKILETARRGVLAMNGEDGYPYAIPLDFWYCEEKNAIYFHGAKAGAKAELLEKNEKVCFTVTGNETVKEEDWAPFLQSVVLFGRCRILTDQKETLDTLRQFALKYYPDEEMVDKEIFSFEKAVRMYEIKIEHMTGKEIQEK